jgi:hypothetical protein
MLRLTPTALAAMVCTLTLSGLAAPEPGPAKPTPGTPAVPTTPPTDTAHRDDERAILEVVSRWDQGWKTFNAELASRDYAPDADWTNAFGLPKRGKVEIVSHLVMDEKESRS